LLFQDRVTQAERSRGRAAYCTSTAHHMGDARRLELSHAVDRVQGSRDFGCSAFSVGKLCITCDLAMLSVIYHLVHTPHCVHNMTDSHHSAQVDRSFERGLVANASSLAAIVQADSVIQQPYSLELNLGGGMVAA
jgi:hypothetical protein